MKEKNTISDTILGYGGLILFCTIIGGGLGYISQTGLLDIIYAESSNSRAIQQLSYDRASKPISTNEYTFRTRMGWWIGCGVGAVLGICVMLKQNDD